MTMSAWPPSAPWTRVRQVTAVPDPVTVSALMGLPIAQFAELVRGNLLPRADDKAARAAWSSLWWTLSSDPDLIDRAFTVLSTFLVMTEAALGESELDEPGQGRARKFRAQCLEAWARLARDEGKQPLAWAGAGAADLNPAARKSIALLVSAIATHRATIRDGGDHDRRLWSALTRIGLDPRAPAAPRRDLDRDGEALAWAGASAAEMNDAGRAAGAVLVSAITAHRAATETVTDADRRLWRMLAVVNLDPDDYPIPSR